MVCLATEDAEVKAPITLAKEGKIQTFAYWDGDEAETVVSSVTAERQDGATLHFTVLAEEPGAHAI